MAQSDIDLVLYLGDYIYEYPEGRYANPIALEELGRHVEPLGEILTSKITACDTVSIART